MILAAGAVAFFAAAAAAAHRPFHFFSSRPFHFFLRGRFTLGLGLGLGLPYLFLFFLSFTLLLTIVYYICFYNFLSLSFSLWRRRVVLRDTVSRICAPASVWLRFSSFFRLYLCNYFTTTLQFLPKRLRSLNLPVEGIEVLVKGFLVRKRHSVNTSVFTENNLECPTFLRLQLQPQLQRHQCLKIPMCG